jgi:hypothetical protein
MNLTSTSGIELNRSSMMLILVKHLMVAFVTLITELHLSLTSPTFLTLDCSWAFPASLAFIKFYGNG